MLELSSRYTSSEIGINEMGLDHSVLDVIRLLKETKSATMNIFDFFFISF